MPRTLVLAFCLALAACDASTEDARTPAPTGLVSPATTALDTAATVLSWTAVDGVSRYELEVVRDRGGRRDTLRRAVDAPRFADRVGPGAFRWRVRAVRRGDTGAWSETAQFRLDHARVPVGMGWFLSTAGLQPGREYSGEQLSVGLSRVTSIGRSLDALGLDAAWVASGRIEALQVRFSAPAGATLGAFDAYEMRLGDAPVADLAQPTAALAAPLRILDADLPAALLAGGGVVYRLRVRTGATVPTGLIHTLDVTGEARLELDVSGPE